MNKNQIDRDSSDMKHHHEYMGHNSHKDDAGINHKHQHKKHHNHTTHHKMMMKDFKKRFIISLIISIPILLLSPLIQDFFGFNITFSISNYVLFFLASIVFIYGGWPDDSYCSCHFCCLFLQLSGCFWFGGKILFLGTCNLDWYHALGSLDRDAFSTGCF